MTSGLGSDTHQRLLLWKIMLGSLEENGDKFEGMRESCSEKDIDIIDKDVPRSLHTLYLNDDIKQKRQD